MFCGKEGAATLSDTLCEEASLSLGCETLFYWCSLVLFLKDIE